MPPEVTVPATVNGNVPPPHPVQDVTVSAPAEVTFASGPRLSWEPVLLALSGNVPLEEPARVKPRASNMPLQSGTAPDVPEHRTPAAPRLIAVSSVPVSAAPLVQAIGQAEAIVRPSLPLIA